MFVTREKCASRFGLSSRLMRVEIINQLSSFIKITSELRKTKKSRHRQLLNQMFRKTTRKTKVKKDR